MAATTCVAGRLPTSTVPVTAALETVTAAVTGTVKRHGPRDRKDALEMRDRGLELRERRRVGDEQPASGVALERAVVGAEDGVYLDGHRESPVRSRTAARSCSAVNGFAMHGCGGSSGA